ncbi:hypothetical protein [Legionella parisiensis]|uniref:Uncharacterized protein n=1 Tax=Legionella parisiensis TaxID=45071 RepID=A0A1E5JVV7_9GAMM|nr:hypothetical protein [Legionella parisiensis]KTD41291.1 hypothetical protein Lpar_2608 [Legionella parisiensis]OEH48662.1 hypothetical protein lpari_00271 [Legionella parisiensis]STX76408.1 Uncharacterised protein [Legionella parisiensis]
MRYIYFLLLGLFALNGWTDDSACSPQGAFRATNGCMPVVFVIRHAEDTQTGPHNLTDIGWKHAELYVALFENYIWGDPHSVGKDKTQACVCPIGKIISISNKGENALPPNPNPNPSPNPYNTVMKLSEKLNIPIQTDNGVKQYWSSFQWTAGAKLGLFDNNGNSAPFSVVISWDKQGLNPTKEEYIGLMRWLKYPESQISFEEFIPLLKFFPNTLVKADSVALIPLRTHLWVFSDQNEQGKFINLRFYQQIFYAKDCKSNPSLTPTTNSECLVPQQRGY